MAFNHKGQAMYGQQKEPVVNSILNLSALSTLTPTIEGGAASSTTSAIDAGVPKDREEILFLEVGEITNLDKGFVQITESIDGGVYSDLAILPMSPQATQMRRILRKGRYLKATFLYEFVQVDDEDPQPSAVPLTLKVLR